MDETRWQEVDRYIDELVLGEDPVLNETLRASEAAGLPAISVSPAHGRFLTLLARATGARRILELGTLGGYSTICLARALPPGGRLVTLEADPAHARVALRNLTHAGVSERFNGRRMPRDFERLGVPATQRHLRAWRGTCRALHFDAAALAGQQRHVVVIVVNGRRPVRRERRTCDLHRERRFPASIRQHDFEPRVRAAVVRGGARVDGESPAILSGTGGDGLFPGQRLGQNTRGHHSERLGVARVQRTVAQATLREGGLLDDLVFSDGSRLQADLYIDCSGFRGVLIEGALKTGYLDWSDVLPCESAHVGDTEALGELLRSVGAKPAADPRFLCSASPAAENYSGIATAWRWALRRGFWSRSNRLAFTWS